MRQSSPTECRPEVGTPHHWCLGCADGSEDGDGGDKGDGGALPISNLDVNF